MIPIMYRTLEKNSHSRDEDLPPIDTQFPKYTQKEEDKKTPRYAYPEPTQS